VVAAWEAVAEAAAIGDGTSLLDLGCGDGAFCAFAARRGAIVHGLDVEPDAIAEALEAAPGADLRLGLMEDLPWADASFDVVTSFNGLQYALDPEMALIEASRVVRPGGRIAICKWGRPAENEFFAFLTSIGAGGVRADRLADTDPAQEAIRTTGIEVIATGDVPASIEMADEAALEASLARACIRPEQSPSVAAAPYRRPDGSYRFENRLRFWILGSDR
jgi:SAM-dependent methyltransferase